MTLLKQCSWHGCTKVIKDGIKYCTYHQKKFEQQEKERYREYDKRRKQDAFKRQCIEFYNTGQWERVRQVVIADCYNIDILEYYKTGKVIQGERVHHIKDLNEDWNCRLDLSNLIYLTEQNHRRVHIEYLKGERGKKQMQQILFALLIKWSEEFV